MRLSKARHLITNVISYVVFFIFNDLRREVIICFIDITAIADHANFLFIINDITPKYIAIRRLLKRVLLLVNVKWALIFCQPYLGENVLHIGETMIFDVCPIAYKGCHFNPVNPETLTIKTSLIEHACTYIYRNRKYNLRLTMCVQFSETVAWGI